MVGFEAKRRDQETVVGAGHADRLAVAVDLFQRQPLQHHLGADVVAQDHHADDGVAQRNDDARRHVAEHAARDLVLQPLLVGDG
ncbi:hypothetical protein D9M68_929250 [compost metagenome]